MRAPRVIVHRHVQEISFGQKNYGCSEFSCNIIQTTILNTIIITTVYFRRGNLQYANEDYRYCVQGKTILICAGQQVTSGRICSVREVVNQNKYQFHVNVEPRKSETYFQIQHPAQIVLQFAHQINYHHSLAQDLLPLGTNK